MFIKSIDEQAWVVVLDGWRPPRVTVDVVTILKPESEWTTDERTIPNFNSKALNVIFVSVDVASYHMISNCTEARDAWTVLQEQCEGTTSVKLTKLRMFTTRFQNLMMHDYETISSYHEKLCKISNEAVGLGEPISNEKLVSKVMRSLLERYNIRSHP